MKGGFYVKINRKLYKTGKIDGKIYNTSPSIMLVTFSNGETKLFDATILTGQVYESLKDDKIFKNPVIEHGVVTWNDGDIDCSPEYMYKNSYEYPEVASF